nr:hypothetical protein [Tanacetum cinerariifolium]
MAYIVIHQFVNHQPQEILEVIPLVESKEWIETKNELYKMMEAYTERINQQREQEALLAAQREQELREQEHAAQREQELLAQKQAAQEKEEPPQNSDFRQLIGEMCGIKASEEQKQKLEEMMLELVELCREKELYYVHDIIEITPDLPTKEPEYSLSMGDEHLSTISETELDEVIKSSVKNLVPIPSESEVTFDNESECDVPVNYKSSLIFTTFSNPLFYCNDNFTSSDDKSLSNEDVLMENFKIYSNPLFDDEEIISTKIDLHYFNAESNFLESLLNRDTLIDSSLKFDYLLEEFSGELAHIDPIPPGIKEDDFDLEEAIYLSLSPSPIPIEDNDSHMEEIDLFLAMDELMPPGIENDDYDSEWDIYFLEELLSNDLLPLLENESSNFDHHDDPSFPRPLPEPPDVEVLFDFEPDTGVLTTKVVKGISEHYVLMPNILSTLPTLDPDLDFTTSHDSFGSENKIFDPGIFIKV